MTSATGKVPRVQRGFTIIEIVLVLGLIALAGSIVVANFASMAERGGELSTEESLRAAIRQGRFIAASERGIVSLSFDQEKGALRLSSGQSFQLGPTFSKDGGHGKILFYLVPPAAGLAPLATPDKTRLETSEILFAPDRSSSPFVVEIDSGSGSPERMVFDPFSSLRRRSE